MTNEEALELCKHLAESGSAGELEDMANNHPYLERFNVIDNQMIQETDFEDRITVPDRMAKSFALLLAELSAAN